MHVSRHDWEIPKTRDERIPEPRVGDNPQRFKLYAGHRDVARHPIRPSRSTGAIPCSRSPTRTRVLPSGEVVRREILMESPAEVKDSGDPGMRLPENLSPEQLREPRRHRGGSGARGRSPRPSTARAAARSSDGE